MNFDQQETEIEAYLLPEAKQRANGIIAAIK